MKNKFYILDTKIIKFKQRFYQKEPPFIYKPNNFDLFIDEIVEIVHSTIIKSFILSIMRLVKNLVIYFFSKVSKFKKLEKKISNQEKIIEEALIANKNLSIQINELSQKINKAINNSFDKNTYNKVKLSHNVNTISSKEKFYQDENLRLSNQLHESQKKFEIMKKEIEKYQTQRSNLINKINSVNDVIEDTNIVTNLFDNDQNKNKINIKDTQNNRKKISLDLNQEVKNIFNKS